MIYCEEIDLPSYARVTVNRLSEPVDPDYRIWNVLRVELPRSVRIDADWDRNDCGYWVTAWQADNGTVAELARRWAEDAEALVKIVEALSRKVN